MIVSISNQVYVFFSCIFGGLAIGLLFDIFRLSRKLIETKDIITYIEDIVFWFLVGVIVLMTIYLSNRGQIRGYVFLAIVIGVVFYFMVFSNLIMKALNTIVKTMIDIIGTVIKLATDPLKIIIKVLYYPIKYLYNKTANLGKISVKLIRLLKSWLLRFKRLKHIE